MNKSGALCVESRALISLCLFLLRLKIQIDKACSSLLCQHANMNANHSENQYAVTCSGGTKLLHFLSPNFEFVGETPPGSGGTGSSVNDASMGETCAELGPLPPVRAWNAADTGVLGVGGADDELSPLSSINASLDGLRLDSGSSSCTGARLLFLLGLLPGFDLRCDLGGTTGPNIGELFEELAKLDVDLFAGSQMLSTNG